MKAPYRQTERRRGLTLTEVVVSTAIVGAVVVGSLESAGMVFRTRRLNASPLTGPGLAQELLDEILAMPYEDPQNPGGSIGLDSGESSANRSAFDDVDDYNGWTSGGVRNRAGVATAGFTGWNFQVSVARAQVANPTTNAGSDTGLKRIDVTVTSPANKVTGMSALRARNGSLEQKACARTTAVASLGAELKLGSAATAERWGARPTNHAGDAN